MALSWTRKGKRLPGERINEGSPWRFSCCAAGGPRIRSIVKRSTLRDAGGHRCVKAVDLVVRVGILVN